MTPTISRGASLRSHSMVRKVRAGLAALLLCCVTYSAQAQRPAPAQGHPTPVTLPTTAEQLFTMDLSGMDAAWWAGFVKQQDRALRDRAAVTKEHALRSVIFCALNYPSQTRYERLVPELLYVYRRDRHEGLRIMALAALHATGSEAAMQQLAEHLPGERNKRIQRLTKAVLADHYGVTQGERYVIIK